MSVDIFGRSLATGRDFVLRGPPGYGFSLTSTEDFDLKKKRLCNVGNPIDPEAAINLNTLEVEKKLLEIAIEKLESAQNLLIKQIDQVHKDLKRKFKELEKTITYRIERSVNDCKDHTYKSEETFSHLLKTHINDMKKYSKFNK